MGFFSDAGDLLSVIFDEVQADQDHQSLEFNQKCVEISVKNGKVTYDVSKIKPRKAITPKKRVQSRRLLKR